MIQELPQVPQAALFKFRCQLVKGLQIAALCISTSHGTVDAVQPSQIDAPFHQSCQRIHFCFLPQLPEDLQELLRFRIIASNQGIVDAPLLLFAADPCQIICGKTENGTCQCTDQRDIQSWILDGLQEGTQHTDLFRLQKVCTAAGRTADADRFQRPLEISGCTAG